MKTITHRIILMESDGNGRGEEYSDPLPPQIEIPINVMENGHDDEVLVYERTEQILDDAVVYQTQSHVQEEEKRQMNNRDRDDGPADPLVGTWYLVSAGTAVTEVPDHRVEFVFYESGSSPRGALVSRANGKHVPLPHVEFDGTVLRLKLPVRADEDLVDKATLVVSLADTTFEGHWHDASGLPVGPRLALIRGV